MKTQLKVLMFYLIIFGIITIIGIIDFFNNVEIVDLGLPTRLTNGIIVVLGIAGVIKSIVYLIFYERNK